MFIKRADRLSQCLFLFTVYSFSNNLSRARSLRFCVLFCYRSNVVLRVVDSQLSPGARQAAAARWFHSCGSVLSGGQAVPRLDAHKPHRLCRGRPDERVGVAFHIAGDLAAGVLLIDADRFGAQARHAEAVVCKQVIRQRDGLLVLPLVIAFAGQQAVGVRASRMTGLSGWSNRNS